MNRRNFLRDSSLIIPSMYLLSSAKANSQVAIDKNLIQNWAGTEKFRPSGIYRPKSIQELTQIIQRTEKSISIHGSGHSFNRIMANQTAILTEDLTGTIKKIDENIFEIPGAMKLKEANRLLFSQGYSFSSLGEIEEQSIAGLVSTATHGTGLKWGTISDSIVGMKLILANGTILDLKESRKEDRANLAAARVSLGSLGYILSVSFQLEPRVYLEQIKKTVTREEALNFEFLRSIDHPRLYVLPFTDKVLIKNRMRISKNEMHMSKEMLNEIRKKEKLRDNFILNQTLNIASLAPKLIIPRLFNKLASSDEVTVTQGAGYLIQTKEITMKHNEMEFAVDFRDTFDALTVVEDVIRFYFNKGFICNLPIAIRSVKGDENALLSPTLGRETSYIEVSTHLAKGYGNYKAFYKDIEKELVSSFQARPHWGKKFYQSPFENYPQMKEFHKIRKDLDPNNKFLNPFLKKYLNL